MKEHQNRIEEHKNRILELQTVETLIPHLISKNEEEKKVAILTINSLGHPDLALRLGELYKTKGTQEAVDRLMASTLQSDLTIRESQQFAGQAPGAVQSEKFMFAAAPAAGWAYLGNFLFAEQKWDTRYLEFEMTARPESLVGKTFEVRERTGALNVRQNMPDQQGQFYKVIDVLEPGEKIEIKEISRWESSGYVWARIAYLH